MSESKQFMYGGDYRDALNDYINQLDSVTAYDMLFDFIFEYMENRMTNEQVQQFIETGEF